MASYLFIVTISLIFILVCMIYYIIYSFKNRVNDRVGLISSLKEKIEEEEKRKQNDIYDFKRPDSKGNSILLDERPYFGQTSEKLTIHRAGYYTETEKSSISIYKN